MNSQKISESRQEALFSEVLLRKGNNQCADCEAKSPAWVSLDFRAVICMNCAGAHRSLGPSVTRVRSMKLDAWYEEYLDLIAEISNQHANLHFEGKITNANKRPGQLASLEERKRWVIEKYIKKSFADHNYNKIGEITIEPVEETEEEFGEFIVEDYNQKPPLTAANINLLDTNDFHSPKNHSSNLVQVQVESNNFTDFGPFENSSNIQKQGNANVVNNDWGDFQGSSQEKEQNKMQNQNFDIMALYQQQSNNVNAIPQQMNMQMKMQGNGYAQNHNLISAVPNNFSASSQHK